METTHVMAPRWRSKSILALSALAVALFAVNAVVRFTTGYGHELLWACNLAPLLVAAGLLSGWARVSQLGFNWVCYGTIIWTVQALSGELFGWVSYLNHWGGLALGALALRILGTPRGGHWRAIIAFFALQQLTPALIGAADNVNMAFGVYEGSAVSGLPYWQGNGLVLAGGLLSLWLVEICVRRRWAAPAQVR